MYQVRGTSMENNLSQFDKMSTNTNIYSNGNLSSNSNRLLRTTLAWTSFVSMTLILLSFYVGIKQRHNLQQNDQTIPLSDNESQPIEENKITINYPVNESTIYFVREGKLFKQSPLTSNPVVFIDKVDSYAFSPNKNKIAFTQGYGPDDSSNPNRGDNSVFIKHLQNESVDMVIESKYGIYRYLQWSPTGDYLLVDSGTGPGGLVTIYDTGSWQVLNSFNDTNWIWFDDHVIYYSSMTKVTPDRPWGGGEGFGIGSLDITTGIKNLIVQADSYNDFSLLSLKDSCIYYNKDSVEDPQDWYALNFETTYYCLDLSTNKLNTVQESTARSDKETLLENTKHIFPEYDIGKDEITRVFTNPIYDNWIIMVVYHNDSIYNSDIMLFNLDNPKDTLVSLAKGEQLTWD